MSDKRLHYAGGWTDEERRHLQRGLGSGQGSRAGEELDGARTTWICLRLPLQSHICYLAYPLGGDHFLEASSAAELAQKVHQRGGYTPKEARLQADYVGGLPRARLRRVIEYVRSHLQESITIAELAQVAHMSPYHFARMFKASVGETPIEYITRCRMDAAAGLLSKGDLKIGEVARRVGYRDGGYFARQFRRHRGLSPKAYKDRWGK